MLLFPAAVYNSEGPSNGAEINGVAAAVGKLTINGEAGLSADGAEVCAEALTGLSKPCAEAVTGLAEDGAEGCAEVLTGLSKGCAEAVTGLAEDGEKGCADAFIGLSKDGATGDIEEGI